jgi:glyceraldehyde 3-phosphate dehydrogenase
VGHEAHGDGATLSVDGQLISFSAEHTPGEVKWDVDLVLECSGRFRTIESLAPYFDSACARWWSRRP